MSIKEAVSKIKENALKNSDILSELAKLPRREFEYDAKAEWVRLSIVERILGEFLGELRKRLNGLEKEKEKIIQKIHYEPPNPTAKKKAEQDIARYSLYFINGQIKELERLMQKENV